MRFTFECSGQTVIDRELLRFGDRTVDVSPAFQGWIVNGEVPR